MIEQLNLWEAQDALLAALRAEPAFNVGSADEVAVSLGFPAQIETEHVWIGGEVEGELEAEITGPRPSAETFRLHVFIFVQAPDYEATRSRVQELAAACEAALSSDVFAAVVPARSIPHYRLEAGTDGSSSQLCLDLTVECRCW